MGQQRHGDAWRAMILGPARHPRHTDTPVARPAGALLCRPMPSPVSWVTLSGRARAWRILHASWSIAQLGALGYIWTSAIIRRRTPTVWAAAAFLVAEGAALIVGRGNCPVGRMQAEWGDPVPFFELVLPPRAAKAAVPLLAVVSVAGIMALVFRRPGLRASA